MFPSIICSEFAGKCVLAPSTWKQKKKKKKTMTHWCMIVEKILETFIGCIQGMRIQSSSVSVRFRSDSTDTSQRLFCQTK
jgi:hypothetical protein